MTREYPSIGTGTQNTASRTPCAHLPTRPSRFASSGLREGSANPVPTSGHIAAFLALLICFFCSSSYAKQKTVNFTASDGCRIEAFFSAPSSGSYVFINTHGLGSDRNEWAGFETALEKAGFGYLSLDMRGHGKSRTCRGKPADYRTFSRTDWTNASRDIEAAATWLKKKGIGNPIFCGASIGANLSLKAAAEGKIKPAGLVLLSPGLDYAGIKPLSYLERSPEKILIMAAEDDPYSWKSSGILGMQASRAKLRVSVLDGGSGHGANMLRNDGIIEKILDWAAGIARKKK